MPGQATINIEDREWQVWLATTYAELFRGLSGVPSMPAGTGVLSVLPQDQVVSVSTEAIYFPIDIIFISSDLTVIDVAKNISPGMLVTEETPARYILEVNAGEAADIESGEVVNVTIYQSATNNWIAPLVSFAGLMTIGAFMVGTAREFTQAILGKPGEEPEKPELYGPRGERLLPQTTTIEDGEVIPPQYRHLVDLLPVPEFALSVEYLPAVQMEPGETKTDALLRNLKDGVQRIQTSPEFRNYLIAMSRFHNYSWNNQLLIMMQRPDATHVAGFNTWKDLGRWVKKGERGIAIFAPSFHAADVIWARHTDGMRWRIRRIGEEWGIYEEERLVERRKTKREAERQLRTWGATEERIAEAEPRFLVVYVFDIAQTEGEPLPEFEVPVLTGEVNEELFARLRALMKQRGVTVSFESRPYLSPEVKGQYLAPNEIWVRPEEPPAQQLKTLLHEIAHYYSEGVFRIPRRDAETIAESAAFVVGAHYGFDTGVRSFPYVALWAQDEKVLSENLGAIQRVSNTILEELGKAGEKEGFSPQLEPKYSMLGLPEEAKKDPLFVEYIQDMVRLGEKVSDSEATAMWQKWKKRREQQYLPQTTARTELRFASEAQTVMASTLLGWLRRGTAYPIQTAGYYGAEGYKPRLYAVGDVIYQIEWGPAKKHHLLPARLEHMTYETKERLREQGVEIGPPGAPPPGKATRHDVIVGAKQKLGVWITDNRTGATLAEWTDADARGLFEVGLLRGRVPVSAWEAPPPELVDSVLDYAESVGLLTKEGSVSYLPQTEKGQYAWLITDPETGEIMIKPGYATVSKAKRSASDFALRRAKYAGEHPVKFRIYDRDPDIGHLHEGVVFEGEIAIPGGRIVEGPWEKQQKSPAVIPAEPGPPRRRKSELEFFPDSPEFLTQTVEDTGYRGKLDTAFQKALKRAKGVS